MQGTFKELEASGQRRCSRLLKANNTATSTVLGSLCRLEQVRSVILVPERRKKRRRGRSRSFENFGLGLQAPVRQARMYDCEGYVAHGAATSSVPLSNVPTVDR